MRKLLTLFGIILSIALYAQPGSPDASGVIQPGPPWVTGISTGGGEMELQLDYLQDGIDSLQTGVFNVLNYGVVSGDGLPDIDSINAVIAIAAALPTFGDIPVVLVPYGRYNLDKAIILSGRVSLKISPNALFTVAADYAGAAISLETTGNERDAIYEGGYFLGSTHTWTGIKATKTTSSSYAGSFLTFRNMQFSLLDRVIDISVDNDGWFNENLFDRIKGINFISYLSITEGSGTSQSRGNIFSYCPIQAGTMTKYGLEAVQGDWNTFVGCNFWDFNVSDSANMQIGNDISAYTRFIGCRVMPSLKDDKPATSILSNEPSVKLMARQNAVYDLSGTADTIVYLPNGCILWDINVRVNTAFNDSGADLLDIGYNTSTSAFDNDIDVSTTGFKTAGTSDIPNFIWNRNSIVITYTGENGDATAGQATVFITYTLLE